MKKQIPELVVILKSHQIPVKNVKWDNVNIIGDNNIDHIIRRINYNNNSFIRELKKISTDYRLSESEKKFFKKQVISLTAQFSERNETIVNRLQKLKPGINKPTLPCFRYNNEYCGKHVVVFICKNKYINPIWRSIITSSYENQGEEIFITITFSSLIDKHKEEILEKRLHRFPEQYLHQTAGFHWKIPTISPMIMSYKELLFFKSNPSDEFLKLWFYNSSDVYVKTFHNFKAILKEPLKESVDFNFKKAIPKLVHFLEDGNSLPEKDRGQNIELERIVRCLKFEFLKK